MERKKVVIMGAAGRDFHNFNVVYRGNPEYEVVAFTAAQIPYIAGRTYPPVLAGRLYPDGIPIVAENELTNLIKEHGIDEVVFSYSDLSHETIMHKASEAIAAGASFRLLGASETMVKSSKPVISICAVRTGSGKSQTARRVSSIIRKKGLKAAVIRHPMPYGDLARQEVQRFATIEDMKRHKCTIEEMEEYEPHIAEGVTVYAGVDYEKILRQAEQEADVILWDGGNNDTSFYQPDLSIVVADPLRAGHEVSYHPGEVNFRLADVIVINKVDSAKPEYVQKIRENAARINPKAQIIEAESVVNAENPSMVRGKRVLVVEDGPTLTHGEMAFGAGMVAAKRLGAREFVDPRQSAVGTIRETFEKYPNTGKVLPAMGYGERQVRDLEQTINSSDAECVVIGTPIDLSRVISIEKPFVRVRYDLKEVKGSIEPAVLKVLDGAGWKK